MLMHLEIANIAIIDRIKMSFEKGLNILTGETGAGKSIIIDSINALLGMRTSRELIRDGEEKAIVEGIFRDKRKQTIDFFEKTGIEPEDDGSIIISREMFSSGRNICRINGKLASVSTLRELGEKLIDIHGQHDSQSLLRTEMHLELLDSFGGGEIEDLKEAFRCLTGRYRDIEKKIRKLSGDSLDRERKIDLLKYQVGEIERANLYEGEEEDLKEKRNLLANSEKIYEVLSEVYDLLAAGSRTGNSLISGINHAMSRMEQVSSLSDKFSEFKEEFENIAIGLDDVAHDIRKQLEHVDFSPDELDTVEGRLDLIQSLKRKYGATVTEIIRFGENTQKELDEILENEKTVALLNEEMESLREELLKCAQNLNKSRRKAGEVLEDKIGTELDDLEMKGARFKVNIESQVNSIDDITTAPPGNGFDSVEFLVSVNEGESLKQLSKTASGGEMSRIMLAIKKILADVDQIPTLIFDEIDIGIGGETANKLGEKLKFISGTHQVICVTHLAQIACEADAHYLIEKTTLKGRTRTSVRTLKDDEITGEIARLMSGSGKSELSLMHAREMLEKQKT